MPCFGKGQSQFAARGRVRGFPRRAWEPGLWLLAVRAKPRAALRPLGGYLARSPFLPLNCGHEHATQNGDNHRWGQRSDTAKTAICLLRYRPEEVVAVLDRQSAGKTCQEVFGVGGQIPVVASLVDTRKATRFWWASAPPGGKIPPHWRSIILDAIVRRLTIVSGLHELLRDDAEFCQAAERYGVELVDVRWNDEHDVANREGLRPECLRIHTMPTIAVAARWSPVSKWPPA